MLQKSKEREVNGKGRRHAVLATINPLRKEMILKAPNIITAVALHYPDGVDQARGEVKEFRAMVASKENFGSRRNKNISIC